ncbi:MAG: hypothetical protein LWW85_09475 [Marinilabiliales bacterium]|nr:hypothetical protein [Marinilabiliales bacterium]
MTRKRVEMKDHGPEVREIMGSTPPWFTRNGIGVVLLLFSLLLAFSGWYRYPDVLTRKGIVRMNGNKEATLEILGEPDTSIRMGQKVTLGITGYPELEDGVVEGMIMKTEQLPTGDRYSLLLQLPNGMVTRFGKKIAGRDQWQTTVRIFTEKRSFWNRLAKSFYHHP